MMVAKNRHTFFNIISRYSKNIVKNPLAMSQPKLNSSSSPGIQVFAMKLYYLLETSAQKYVIWNETKALIKQLHVETGMHNLPSELKFPNATGNHWLFPRQFKGPGGDSILDGPHSSPGIQINTSIETEVPRLS